MAKRVDELVELMGLGAFRTKFLRELSTGSRRIVDLACVVAHRPTVILFDEPSSGIAQRETEALGPVLLQIREGLGAALLVIEHDMPLVSSVSDRLIAMDQGRVIAEGPPDVVLTDPLVVESYLGSNADVLARSGARADDLKRPFDQASHRHVQQHQGDPSHGTSDRPIRRLRGGAMRRWGPIIAIVVVAAIVAALVVMGGDDDEASDDGGDGGHERAGHRRHHRRRRADLPVQLG